MDMAFHAFDVSADGAVGIEVSVHMVGLNLVRYTKYLYEIYNELIVIILYFFCSFFRSILMSCLM